MKALSPEQFFGLEGEDAPRPWDRVARERNRRSLDEALARARRAGATHIVRYEVLDFGSSHLGERKVLLVGPGFEVESLDEALSIKVDAELAATTKWPVAYMEVPDS